jgi:hypothetical protein
VDRPFPTKDRAIGSTRRRRLIHTPEPWPLRRERVLRERNDTLRKRLRYEENEPNDTPRKPVRCKETGLS